MKLKNVIEIQILFYRQLAIQPTPYLVPRGVQFQNNMISNF